MTFKTRTVKPECRKTSRPAKAAVKKLGKRTKVMIGSHARSLIIALSPRVISMFGALIVFFLTPISGWTEAAQDTAPDESLPGYYQFHEKACAMV